MAMDNLEVWLTVGSCLWWTPGGHGTRAGTSGTAHSQREGRLLSLLFVLPTAQAAGEVEVVQNGPLSSRATSVTSVTGQSAKCRTLLNEGLNCPLVPGEAAVLGETVDSETDDESPDSNNTTKNSDDGETVDSSNGTEPSTVFTNRVDGKRQLFLGQNGDGGGSGGHALSQATIRPGSNQGSGGVSHRITTGSSPEAAVSMVQSFVEDMVNRPDRDRPGYVMINSPNPAIIQQLVAALTQRYGSASIVRNAGAIQDLTGGASGDSRVQALNTSSTAASSDIPVFPFESRWEGGSSSEVPVDPEVDYIRQQLASLAHISVSTGKLVNDTLVNPPATTTTPKPASATVVPSTPIATQDTDDHFPTQGHANHNSQQPGTQTTPPTESNSFNSEELQSLDQEFSPQDSDLTPEGQYTLSKVTGQQVEHVNDFQHLLDDEGHEEQYRSETSDSNGTTGNDMTFPQDTHRESEYMNTNLTDPRHTHSPPTDKNESVIISSLILNTSPPDVTYKPATNNTSSSKDTPKYGDHTTSTATDEESTAGYEDYYEEIDGELVLSPTKFMRKGSPQAVTPDYVSDEDYHQVGGSGHRTGGGDRPVLLQHGALHQAATDWALASHGVEGSEPASMLRPHNPSLFPTTTTGDVLADTSEDSSPSQYPNPVPYKGNIPDGRQNTPLAVAGLQAYPNSYFHVDPDADVSLGHLKPWGSNDNGYHGSGHDVTTFTSTQNLGDEYIRQRIPPLYQNYGDAHHTPRPPSVDLEGSTDGPVQSSSGGSLPVHPYLVEEHWNMDEDSFRLSLLQELDRIPVVYEDEEDLVTSSTILRALLSSDALDHLARMDEGDLATLGLLDHVQTGAGSLREYGHAAVHPVGEGFPGTDSTTQGLVKSRDGNTTSVGGVSKELTSSQADGVQSVAEGELTQEVPVRSSFSSGNYRQSGGNDEGQAATHPAPPDFFPRRPTEAPHPGSGHRHGSTPHRESGRPQLTPEQQGIISRLPEGMRHVVSSIVLAVQAPSSITTSTTTVRPQHYPYPYPYPYPPYPYLPPPTYPYPYPPRPAGLDGGSDHLAVHGAHEVDHGVLTDHGVHGAHDGHGVHGAHGGHGVHGAHDGHGVHGAHDGHGVHGPREDHSPHSSGVIHENHGSPSAHGNHGPHGTQSSQFVPASHGNAEAVEAHHGHSSHGHGSHHGNHGSDGNDDLRGGAADEEHAEDDLTATPNRLVTSTAPRGTPRPAVLTPSAHNRAPGASPALPVVISLPSSPPTYNPAAVVASRLGELDATSLVEDISETGVRDNDNERGSISRIGPSRPDRNQGLLNLRRDPAQMGHGRPSGGGFVSYRPQQQASMHMGAPVVNVVLPERTTSVPVPAEEEIGPLIEPGEEEDDGPVTKAPETMDREQVNSLLQSLFSSPTLLLMGIVFAASAAYMAIAMEEQAAQQNFQQAQLAAAFGGQPFPPGRRRRRRNLSSPRLWYPRRPQIVDLDRKY